MHNNKTQFILNQLYRLNPPGRIELTLDRIKRLLKDLGNPEKKLKNVIIVGGTNGKGSTIEFLRSILSENNYSVMFIQVLMFYPLMKELILMENILPISNLKSM